MTHLCTTFRTQAGAVWSRMYKAQALGLALSEETITESVMFEIAQAHRHNSKFRVAVATKPQEAIHGADWEWWITKNGVGLSFRVQAKRLFPSGRYESLFKAGADPLDQLKKLVSKAQVDGHIPLYCFYNFDHPTGQFSSKPVTCNHTYRGPTYWGCALASPYDIETADSDKLFDLRVVLHPWHKLVCDDQHGLPQGAVKFINSLRAPSLGAIYRATIDFAASRSLPEQFSLREVPGYVRNLIELDHEDVGLFDFENLIRRGVAIPEGIKGVAVINDQRG